MTTHSQRALILYRRRRFINYLLTYLLTYIYHNLIKLIFVVLDVWSQLGLWLLHIVLNWKFFCINYYNTYPLIVLCFQPFCPREAQGAGAPAPSLIRPCCCHLAMFVYIATVRVNGFSRRSETFSIGRQRHRDRAIKFARWQHPALGRGARYAVPS